MIMNERMRGAVSIPSLPPSRVCSLIFSFLFSVLRADGEKTTPFLGAKKQ